MNNFQSATSKLWSWPRRALLALSVLLFLPASSYAADTLCAKVKIEIQQKLTMERQGFDAMMKINNGLTTTSLDNVAINVNFTDDAGNAVKATSDPTDTTASFFIRIDTMTGITDVSGAGTVAPATTAEIHWLIIPAPGAGGVAPTGKLYYVGATLTYSLSGQPETFNVSPDFIYVKPMPMLTLDYFMTKDVYGDDPMTPQIEPSEPYTLGVRIRNDGAAAAQNVKIDSAQPKIVDNQQGLLINFAIIGSYVNDAPSTNSLLIPFGDIGPNGGTSNGRWIMTSSLMGHFTDFSVSFTHDDSLGGQLTSLMKATNAHFLIHDVKVDMPGRDNIRDFLALDGSALRVYESSGVDTLVTDQSAAAVMTSTGTDAAGNAYYAVSFPPTAGPVYMQLPDPFSGTKAVGQMTRSDGKTLPTENVWLSKSRDASNVLHFYVNLFDTDSTGVYNAAFAVPAAAPRPPVIQMIPDSTVTEGKSLSFIVLASNPDGTVPVLSTSLLPAGATFTSSVGANNVATGNFSWTPPTGSAGKYPITFTATEGTLKTATSTNVTVTTPIVPAGPDMPLIAAPQVATDVNTVSPSFAIAPSRNVLDTATNYHIQVFSDPGMQNLVVEKLGVPRAGAFNTVWTVPTAVADNTWYYWRVRASDGTTYSSWSVGRFFVNTANDPPAVPVLAAPAANTTVSVTTPVLSAINSTDPDGDQVTYAFEVFSDALLTQKVAAAGAIPAGASGPGNSGTTSWTVSPALNDATQYYWRVTATDIHGAKTVSATGNFFVDSTKPNPGAPALVSPAPNGVATVNSADLTVANSVRTGSALLSYYFEVDTSPSFASPSLIRSGPVAEGSVNTAFTITGLAEDAHYYWRVKASDGLTESPWTYGDFMVDTVNDPPTVPGAINPGNNAWVTTTNPLFTLAPSVDPEGDNVAYRIEVYSDAALTAKVMDIVTNNVSWLPSGQLTNETRYYWRVRAEDMRGGLSAWSPTSTFLVRTGSSASLLPMVALTNPARVVNVPAVTVSNPTVAVNLTWEIDDPLNNSKVALYYTTDPASTSGTKIIDGLQQNPNTRLGSYSWDVTSLAPGTYYVYAMVSNLSGSMTRYGPGSFMIPVPSPRGIITVTPTTGLQTTKAGGQAQFSVVLGNSPKADVTIGLSSTKPNDGLTDQQQLVFSAANWNTPQVVTVTGQQDCTTTSDVPYQVVTANAVSTDPDYNGVKGADVSLLNLNSTVSCPTKVPPVVSVGPAQTVAAGATVALNGSATDQSGTIVSYAWTQTAGPTVALADPTKAVTSFTAPTLATDSLLTLQLTVTDSLGQTGSATINITVKASPNVPPTANPGAAQTVNSGSTVTLAGKGTSTTSTIASYAWTQIAGPAVTLTGANTATATFTAPVASANTVLGFNLTVTDALGMTGTSSVSITVLPDLPPTVNAGANQSVKEAATVTLGGTATSTTSTVASYAWTQTGGPTVTLTNANTVMATFIAPPTSSTATLTFQLTATDALGVTGTATTTVTVNHVNVPPTANAGANQSVNESTPVTLTGSGTDVDGTVVSYAWVQTAGPTVALTNANAAIATFTAPATMTGVTLTFKLTVTDNQGATGSATTNVVVNHVNVPPTANAGANQSVNESTPVTLTGSGTDVDGTVVSYAWVQTAGPTVALTNANAAIATFTAPATMTGVTLTFKLTVTDNQGATGSATTNVVVNHVNIPPTANAGANQTVNENTVTTLNGSGTDVDGTIASYAWVQTAGPAVTITNANAATASFIAPVAVTGTVLTFKLTVTDNQGATGSATTTVTVKHTPPVANAGAAQTVNEATTATLTGSGSSAASTIASYAWVQTGGPAVTLANANAATATFTAPVVVSGTTLTFQLTVTDALGVTATATTTVTVNHVPPTAKAGANQTVNEATPVTLGGSGTSVNSTIASYAWTQTGGPTVTLANANAATATFTAPVVVSGTVLTFKLTVTDALGVTGTSTTTVTVNHAPPVANAGVNQTVNEATTATLSGSGTSAASTIASYAWVQTGGPAVTLTNANAATASFTAPVAVSGTTLTFQLTVTDALGVTATATTTVTVKHTPPVANAGANQTVTEATPVTLSGSGTSAASTIASYAWTQTGGPAVTLSNANTATPSFTAPVAASGTTLTFQLTVTDALGATGTATTSVTVKHVPPVANAGASQTVTEATTATLSGSGTSNASTIASYAWVQTGGPAVTLNNANTPTASFTAPVAVSGTVLTFQLTVTDALGATGTATTSVTVKHTPPVANAGANQTVTEATTATLSGSGTSNASTIASYAWTQTGGPAVTLTNANAATASFTAPVAVSGTTLTFQLTVTDALGVTGTSTTTVTVKHIPPTANAGADQTVNEATPVTLSGSGASSASTIASYAWTQTAGPTVTLANANTATASFTAPVAVTGTVLTFQLTVTDALGATATATTNVTVKHTPPVANAGVDQTVTEAATATLGGSGTSAASTIASYAWVQTAGPAVTLTNANAATASFTAPVAVSGTVLTFQLTVTDALGVTGTATTNVTVKHVPPVANAGANQTVNEATPVTLGGSGTSANSTIASYAWVQTAGPAVTLANASTATPTFTAPVALTGTVLTFKLTVTDALGVTGTATTNVTVNHIPPTANAGASQTVTESTPVTLGGSGASANSTIASYAWVQTGGPIVTLSNANTAKASFTAPVVASGTVLTFQLTVTDALGVTGTATTTVTVNHIPPVVNAGASQTVNEVTAVTLGGSATTTASGITSYTWTQTGGPTVALSNANTATASFTAPPARTGTVLTFQLTVIDSLGGTSSATTSVTIIHTPPTVSAGASQTVYEKDDDTVVTLSGSASSPTSTIASYTWTQTGGPAVTLANANTATATFALPDDVDEGTVFTFQLTVTDNLGGTASATTTVTVVDGAKRKKPKKHQEKDAGKAKGQGADGGGVDHGRPADDAGQGDDAHQQNDVQQGSSSQGADQASQRDSAGQSTDGRNRNDAGSGAASQRSDANRKNGGPSAGKKGAKSASSQQG